MALEQLLAEERDEAVAAAMAFALAASAARRTWIGSWWPSPIDDTANQALDYIVELGTTQPSALAPYLRHADPIVRERVATAMGFVGDTGAEAALSPLTSDGDPSVRRAAESALIRMRATKQAGAPR